MAARLDPTVLDHSLEDVLVLLRQQLEVDVAVATRRDGDELEVVATAGHGLAVPLGLQGSWSDSICGRMSAGEGPRAAHEVASVPAYAETPVARALGIGAYIGVPIMGAEGVVGSVCGLDRRPQDATLGRSLPLLEVCSRLIGQLWQAQGQARTDPLTGLLNRRGWQEAVAAMEDRCRRSGDAAAVLAVDLDGFKEINDRHGYGVGDDRLRRAADAIVEGVREHDVVARWGGDEFCVLAEECDEDAATLLGHRVRRALNRAGVPASVGVASRDEEGLEGAMEAAFAAVRGLKGTRARGSSLARTDPGPNAARVGALL
jgi:diguanylate cyclase